jgi:hypothetical protein
MYVSKNYRDTRKKKDYNMLMLSKNTKNYLVENLKRHEELW